MFNFVLPYVALLERRSKQKHTKIRIGLTHYLEKVALKADGDNDRNNTNSATRIICYDLQSVFSLPKGNASAFYYKRKLSMYNLTATVIIPNVKPFTYCSPAL